MKKKPISYESIIKFSFVFLGIFLITFLGLYILGLVPNELSNNRGVLSNIERNAIELATTPQESVFSYTPVAKDPGEEPVYITIPHTQVDIIVQNPKTTDTVLLDEYLKQGVVRYPESPLLGDGNVLLFGHSSNWKVVQNKAYKALNGIETLQEGDLIFVDSSTHRFVYSVLTVKLVDAEDQFVDFTQKDNMLTLSTCNTFGKKQERYVVQAKFVEKVSL